MNNNYYEPNYKMIKIMLFSIVDDMIKEIKTEKEKQKPEDKKGE